VNQISVTVFFKTFFNNGSTILSAPLEAFVVILILVEGSTLPVVLSLVLSLIQYSEC
jgi:hypothetical protein